MRRVPFDARLSRWSAMVVRSHVPARNVRCVPGRGMSSPSDLARPRESNEMLSSAYSASRTSGATSLGPVVLGHSSVRLEWRLT